MIEIHAEKTRSSFFSESNRQHHVNRVAIYYSFFNFLADDTEYRRPLGWWTRRRSLSGIDGVIGKHPEGLNPI
jgi:hypothetical protein